MVTALLLGVLLKRCSMRAQQAHANSLAFLGDNLPLSCKNFSILSGSVLLAQSSAVKCYPSSCRPQGRRVRPRLPLSYGPAGTSCGPAATTPAASVIPTCSGSSVGLSPATSLSPCSCPAR